MKKLLITISTALLLMIGSSQVSAAGAYLNGIGSRGIVTSNAHMYGGFQLTSPTLVYIAVRGPSLRTLGITNNPLISPALRLYDVYGNDILHSTTGGIYVNACFSNNPVAYYYASVRRQTLDFNEPCVGIILSAGVYTFSITPSPGALSQAGEVLFEVTLNP